MSIRDITVQYVGDTLYLPPLEREVKHIVVREAGVADWIRYEPIVYCRDCKFYQPKEGAMLSCKFEYHGFTQWKLAEPDGFCAWGERSES